MRIESIDGIYTYLGGEEAPRRHNTSSVRFAFRMRFQSYKWPPEAALKMLRGILVEIVKTSGLVAIFYFFSISLTFYNKWTLSVSGTVSAQCPQAIPHYVPYLPLLPKRLD